MPTKEELEDFVGRAAELRIIAQGVFDKDERKTLLDFVSEAQRLLTKKVSANSATRFPKLPLKAKVHQDLKPH